MGVRLSIIVTPEKVQIGDKTIYVDNLRPVELLLAALAYGIGIRYIDKTGEAFEMQCEVEGYQIKCEANCTGEEERCLVFRTVTKGIQFTCRDKAQTKGRDLGT
ncbi:MAG: hypothetical protein OWQ51_07800 [Pyrobaculum arsenaticum]|nr:hypothetical protein [Pyrobaculum arsenaticum]MCY0890867.1 hypothetical protein [Pyrobaculum arsenaticum]NYR15686.1 hypothetical protein [Pyrobaculum arsenaticum]